MAAGLAEPALGPCSDTLVREFPVRFVSKEMNVKASYLLPIFVALAALPTSGQSLQWIQQFGTSNHDEYNAVAADHAGNVYCTGFTERSLFGPSAGLFDVILSKHDPAGALLWARQIGTTTPDGGAAVAVDSASNSYVTGTTFGSLGGTNLGQSDMFIAKFDVNGTLMWAIQQGTAKEDRGSVLTVDGVGNIYAAGITYGDFGGINAGHGDMFLAKCDPSGSLLWVRQVGTSNGDDCKSAATDAAGNVYLCGYTLGGFAGQNAGHTDSLVIKYDSSGVLVWARQVGTALSDSANGIALDSAGNAIVGITTAGPLGGISSGGYDVSLAKFDPSGTLLWVQQVGSPGEDFGYQVAVDGADNAYVAGFSSGSFGGPISGLEDAFLLKYDPLGTLIWTRQFGTSSLDRAYSVAVAPTGDVYVGGRTFGSLGGAHAGISDAYLAKFDNSCTSAFSYCAAKVSSSGCLPAMSASGVASLSVPNSFVVTANALEQGQNGIMLFGTTGPATAPFQGGTLCVKAPWYRLGAQNSGGSAACTGSISYKLTDMLADPQGGPLLIVNQGVNIQTWFRDPPSASRTGLSNGLQVTICL